MEKLSKNISVITVAMFIGIILFFGIYFNFAATCGYEVDKEVSYNPEGIILPFYSDAVYKNKGQNDSIKYYSYRLFCNIENPNIVLGDNGFVFEIEKDDGSYNYFLDYMGQSEFTDEQLDMITKVLTMRKQAYENEGVSYIIAVVPNCQSIYSENLPWYVSTRGSKTRLAQLSEYMSENSDINFINLTDTFILNKSYGQLLNNTENSINSLGAYIAYREIYNNIPENLVALSSPIKYNELYFCTHITKGKTIAQEACLENYIKNITVSLSNETILKYNLVSEYNSFEETYIAPEYAENILSDTKIMIEFTDDWNKIQFMPYFSNTFKTVSYRNSQLFSKFVVDLQSPNCVIQIINEDELLSLLDENTIMSYNAGLKSGENLLTSTTP